MYEDKELQEYRDLLETPDHFEEGFDWKTVVGAIFIGFLMMPGSMYLQLVIGTGIGPAARWVTIILFAELAKRSYSELKQQESRREEDSNTDSLKLWLAFWNQERCGMSAGLPRSRLPM